MSSNLVIVAVPDENDRVWKVSSEKVPHLTLLFLGDTDQVSNVQGIVDFVEHAANTTLRRFYLPVDRRGELGADQADVLFFKKGRYDFKAVRDFRATLLQDHSIKTAYDSSTQFDGPWTPHLTLGYPTTPANKMSDDQIGQFYDVQFNKIAVWTGDFEGPEFLLRDCWDDYDVGDIPMDVAMSDLQHVGVKGMRWGQRKTETITVGDKTKMVTPKKAAKADEQWSKEHASSATWVKVHNAGADHFNKHIGDLNNKPEYKDLNLVKEPNSPLSQKYMTDVHNLSKAGLEKGVNEIAPSPTGKHKVVVVHGSQYGEWGLAKDHAQHAVGDEITWVKPKRDAKGKVISVEFVLAPVAHTVELGVGFLEHFGIKGMRWGQRKDRSVETVGKFKTLSSRAKSGDQKTVVKGDDRRFKRVAKKSDTYLALHDRAVIAAKSDRQAINNKPEFKNASFGFKPKVSIQIRGKDHGSALHNKYKQEHYQNYVKHFNEQANKVTSQAGTKQYAFRDIPNAGKLSAKRELYVKDIKHADVSDNVGDGILIVELVEDADGKVIDYKSTPVVPAAKHTAELGAEFLEHYGIKGMRWGQRKEPPSAVAPQAVSHVPHGAKRKTQIDVAGGENHPAHEDAIKVARAQTKLKKSGTAALSNQELRDMVTRLQLESQVSGLTTSRGRKFVSRQFENQSQQAVQKGAQAGIKRYGPRIIKKAGKGAATVAVSALL